MPNLLFGLGLAWTLDGLCASCISKQIKIAHPRIFHVYISITAFYKYRKYCCVQCARVQRSQKGIDSQPHPIKNNNQITDELPHREWQNNWPNKRRRQQTNAEKKKEMGYIYHQYGKSFRFCARASTCVLLLRPISEKRIMELGHGIVRGWMG